MTRSRRRQPWTFSADNPTARARTIARGCWHALARVDPDTAESIRAMAAMHGEADWLTPSPATYVEGEPLTRQQVAVLGSVDTPAVVMWGKRGIRRAGATTFLRPIDGTELYDHHTVVTFLRLRETPDTRAPRRKATPCLSTPSATSPHPTTGCAPAAPR